MLYIKRNDLKSSKKGINVNLQKVDDSWTYRAEVGTTYGFSGIVRLHHFSYLILLTKAAGRSSRTSGAPCILSTLTLETYCSLGEEHVASWYESAIPNSLKQYNNEGAQKLYYNTRL